MSTLLYILKPEDYLAETIKILKGVSKDYVVIYVTTNKLYSGLKEVFLKNGINIKNIFFIDCVSKNVDKNVKAKEDENVVFLDSASNLTNISIAIIESIKVTGNKKILFLDSLSTLALFNDVKVLQKFSYYIVNEMAVMGCDTAILTLESDMDKNIVEMVKSIVDQVIKL
ncbi:hypothetical protein M1384_01205 [Candidatus Parvarchaeota archaeon]|jgi:KaiC/GvpD/RAD55 family RecA-like ATPase|nr:hypothetical protein [Candidatus Parvarchaeota archaeon]